ncbi:MAG: DUF1674 domain-containing protein [Alphaproteobacteria bacterium]
MFPWLRRQRRLSIYRGMDNKIQQNEPKSVKPSIDAGEPGKAKQNKTAEVGGPSGPEPTRYGDWERGGRCVDF